MFVLFFKFSSADWWNEAILSKNDIDGSCEADNCGASSNGDAPDDMCDVSAFNTSMLDVSESDSTAFSVWHDTKRLEINCKQQCSLRRTIIACRISLTSIRDGGRKMVVNELLQICAAPPKLNFFANSMHRLCPAAKINASSTNSSWFNAACSNSFIWNV